VWSAPHLLISIVSTANAMHMVQWAERDWNNRFMNLFSFPWLSENSEAVHQAYLFLQQTGRQAGRQAGR